MRLIEQDQLVLGITAFILHFSYFAQDGWETAI